MPESINNPQSSETDNEQLLKLLSAIDKKISIINFSYLGKPNPITSDKPRPIKIVLSNAIKVFEILCPQSIFTVVQHS